ncbi:MAG TPA: oligoendopeptidase F [Erysipelothrix sp.]|nr:oligoendopeptidase F [Erysipelothrix sp.]
MLKRNEVPVSETWDLTTLFKTEADYEKQLEKAQQLADQFVQTYQGQLNTVEVINTAINDYQYFLQTISLAGTYVSLNSSTDLNDPKNLERQGHFSQLAAKISAQMSFFISELLQVEESILKDVRDVDVEHEKFINDLLKDKKHYLHPEAEKALASLSNVLNAAPNLYNTIKLGDMDFGTFTANNKAYPLSFVLFENEYDYELDHEVRHQAHQKFAEVLARYEKTTATNYLTHVRMEKTLSQLRGFDSVLDYLLDKQDVSRDLYDRQIDVIMEKFAPVARKYANILKDIHGLDEMTFMDLKLVVDPDFEPEITIEESKEYLVRGLEMLGEDYVDMIQRAYDERWIDFVQNQGKSTGAFCSSPYGAHPFILISWTSRMREVFVMAHELGHAGHFYLAHQNQNLYNSRPSMYFVEAPSTMNELIMANQLLKETQDPRMQRWIYSTLIARTYYHNFVTHLLEAHWQRKVYRLVDENRSFNANQLHQMMKETYEEFWGEDVLINEEAKYTWMRQPHYYRGLYPYTYSAGLTIATSVSKRITNEGQPAIDDWLTVLKTGGRLTPVELAALAKVDITTDQPLLETIDYLSHIVDEIERLTDALNGGRKQDA